MKLDLSATSLAVYRDRDNDGKYDDYGDLDNDDNDDYDGAGAGVFVFDPRNPVHKTFVDEWVPELVYHEPYGYNFDGGYPPPVPASPTLRNSPCLIRPRQ